MLRLRNTAFTLLAVAALATPAIAGPGHDHAHGEAHGKASKAAVGHAAPDFELVDHAGNVHKLSDYRGKTVVLEWINPECPFVQRHYEEGTMVNLAKAHGDVVWLAVDSSNFVTAQTAAAFAEKKSLPYPTLLDASGEVGRMYDAKTTPHMFVIDAEGTLVYDGAIDDDPRGNEDASARTNYVAAALDALGAGQTIETATTKPYGCSVKYAAKENAAGASR